MNATPMGLTSTSQDSMFLLLLEHRVKDDEFRQIVYREIAEFDG